MKGLFYDVDLRMCNTFQDASTCQNAYYKHGTVYAQFNLEELIHDFIGKPCIKSYHHKIQIIFQKINQKKHLRLHWKCYDLWANLMSKS